MNPNLKKEEPTEMRVTENITFSGRVVWAIVVLCFILAGIFYDSKRATSQLQRDVVEYQKKHDADILALRAAQTKSESDMSIRSEKFTEAVDKLTATVDEMVVEQRVQTELARLQVYDRWTAGMEEDEQSQWIDFMVKQHPEVDISTFPRVREIQRNRLKDIWNQFDD